MSEAGPLIELVARIIETRRDAGRIGPTWVATGGMVELDPLKAVEKFHPLIWLGCHLELRQLARGILAKKFGPDKKDGRTQDELFPDLQWRYPEARSRVRRNLSTSSSS
jgi:hypothetical protein